MREVEEGMNFDGFLGMALPPAGGQPPGLEGGARGQGGPPPGNPFNLNTAPHPHQPPIRPLQVCAEYVLKLKLRRGIKKWTSFPGNNSPPRRARANW